MSAKLPSTLRALTFSRPSTILRTQQLRPTQRSFQTSRRLLAEPAPVVAVPAAVVQKKPVGAFRGSLFGFLLGSVIAGAGLYYYVIDEYKVSNELLTEDIYALQAAVQRIENYVVSLEDEVKTKK